jgi:hypothetical protein
LDDASKAHLMLIWTLASQHQNRLRLDPRWVQTSIRARSRVNLLKLVAAGFLIIINEDGTDYASTMLSEARLGLSTKQETEEETETEAEKNPPTPPMGGEKFEDENEPSEKVKIDLHMDAFAAMKKRYPFATNEAGKKIYRSDWRRAESEWKKIMRDGKVSPDQILRALDHYAATTEARYVCGAERFLTKKLDDALREADPLDTFDPDDRMTPEEEEYARKAEAGNWQADEIAFWAKMTPEKKAERLAAIERAHGRKVQ